MVITDKAERVNIKFSADNITPRGHANMMSTIVVLLVYMSYNFKLCILVC